MIEDRFNNGDAVNADIINKIIDYGNLAETNALEAQKQANYAKTQGDETKKASNELYDIYWNNFRAFENIDDSEANNVGVAEIIKDNNANPPVIKFKNLKGKPGTNGTNGTNGKDGVSPTVATSSISGGTKVTITDINGAKSFNVMNGTNGKDGAPGVKGATGETGKTGPAGRDGIDGNNTYIINTDLEFIDEDLENFSAIGKEPQFNLDTSYKLSPDDNVILVVFNTTRNANAYIFGTVIEYTSNTGMTKIRTKGHLNKGDKGDKGDPGTSNINEFRRVIHIPVLNPDMGVCNTIKLKDVFPNIINIAAYRGWYCTNDNSQPVLARIQTTSLSNEGTLIYPAELNYLALPKFNSIRIGNIRTLREQDNDFLLIDIESANSNCDASMIVEVTLEFMRSGFDLSVFEKKSITEYTLPEPVLTNASSGADGTSFYYIYNKTFSNPSGQISIPINVIAGYETILNKKRVTKGDFLINKQGYIFEIYDTQDVNSSSQNIEISYLDKLESSFIQPSGGNVHMEVLYEGALNSFNPRDYGLEDGTTLIINSKTLIYDIFLDTIVFDFYDDILESSNIVWRGYILSDGAPDLDVLIAANGGYLYIHKIATEQHSLDLEVTVKALRMI